MARYLISIGIETDLGLNLQFYDVSEEQAELLRNLHVTSDQLFKGHHSVRTVNVTRHHIDPDIIDVICQNHTYTVETLLEFTKPDSEEFAIYRLVEDATLKPAYMRRHFSIAILKQAQSKANRLYFNKQGQAKQHYWHRYKTIEAALDLD